MKKSTLIVALSFMGMAIFQTNSLKAQIIVSQADMPSAGNKYVVVNDSNSAVVVTPIPSGANVTWSYGALGASTVDTIKCELPGATPYAGFFPSSTIALKYSLPGLEYVFLNSSAGALTLQGVEELGFLGNHLVVQFKPLPQKMYVFPVNWKSAWNGGYNYRVQFPDTGSTYDSLRILDRTFYQDTVVSYGNLTTPLGTHSTLNDRTVQGSLDSIFGHSISLNKWVFIFKSGSIDTDYNWIANGQGFNMLSAQVRKGKVKVATWLKSVDAGINTITDNAGSLVYPNPAQTELNIKLASCENGFVKILDVTGKEISTTQFSNKIATINTSHFSSGMYFYLVFDKSNNIIDRGKFSVTK